jgi:hypothetical protein
LKLFLQNRNQLRALPAHHREFIMYEEESPPLAIFGVRIKTIVVLMLISVILLVAVNRSEIESLLQRVPIGEQQHKNITDQGDHSSEDNHLVVDQEMLARAMQEVQVKKLTELESGDSILPTDRFFYVVELVSGGDLEGIELTIEPDYVTLVSEGGTRTTIERGMVRKIHRFKLPPAADNEP